MIGRILDKITPAHIATWTKFSLPFWTIGLITSLPLGLYFGLFNSPADYQQGDSVRIMYIHIPSAIIAISFYFIVGVSSIGVLIYKSPTAEIIATSIAPLGMVATILCLITGAIWGQPTWGTWWVWDARLTSVLILLFFYIAYLATVNSYDNKSGRAKPASILAVAGLINLPIIRFSVDWFNTLHQPASIIRSGGVSIHQDMLVPLILMLIAFICFFAILFVWRVQAAIINRKIKHLIKNQSLNKKQVKGL